MAAPKPHKFEIGRWVRLLKGPDAGKRGQIVGRHGDELELLVKGGPEWPILVDIADIQQAFVDTQSHDRSAEPSSDSRRGSD
jgi:hypothetical protein